MEAAREDRAQAVQVSVLVRSIRWWKGRNEWVKALCIALLALLFLHVFVLRWVTVRSSSMYATLLPGDLLGVERWPVWTGLHRGDIAVFRDPVEDDRSMSARRALVKRVVGLPGDEVELRAGRVFVNGIALAEAPGVTHSYLVRLRKGTDADAFIRSLGLPAEGVGGKDRTTLELPLNAAMAEVLEKRPDVAGLAPMRNATGSPSHIFPFSPYFAWNNDSYGPVRVPAEGDSVRINAATIPLYDRIIARYEGNTLEAVGNDLHINGAKATRYVIAQDYYFVLGDSRHYSADSRYWGFVPADHLIGRAAFILHGADAQASVPRSGRWCIGL